MCRGSQAVSTGTSAAPACARREALFINPLFCTVLPWAGLSVPPPCPTAVPSRGSRDSPRRFPDPAHGAPSPGDCLPPCPLAWSSARTRGVGTGWWRVRGRGHGRWLWGVRLGPAAPGASVGMVPELQRGPAEPGKHSQNMAWGGAVGC